MAKSFFHTCILFLLFPIFLNGQTRYHSKWEPPPLYPVPLTDTIKDDDCQQKDIMDLLRKKDKPAKPPKRVSLLILPTIASNPANGFIYGVGGNVVWYLGPRKTTRISLIGFSATYTTKNQFLSFIKSSLYTKDNKYFLFGDLRYYKYSSPTYGLGTDSPPDSTQYKGGWIWQGAETGDTEGAYPMFYDLLKIHEVVSREFITNFYAGIGYHLDYFWNIDRKSVV